MARNTIYEPHPVSPERKAELLAQGFRIIDARFAPDGQKVIPAPAPEPATEPVAEPVTQEAPAAAEPKKRGRPPKVAPDGEISDKADTPSEK